MKQPAFFIDLIACTGCKTCMVACMDGHDLPDGVLWRIFFLAITAFVIFAIFLPRSIPETVPGINPLSQGPARQAWPPCRRGMPALAARPFSFFWARYGRQCAKNLCSPCSFSRLFWLYAAK